LVYFSGPDWVVEIAKDYWKESHTIKIDHKILKLLDLLDAKTIPLLYQHTIKGVKYFSKNHGKITLYDVLTMNPFTWEF
jgi:hypothetical protein